jgi:MFS superfamily sulfate permease-like transporter
VRNLLPFLRWFPMSAATLRADVVAGITVAMVLVPQSMAYALLAGLPVVYGLYAALLPVVIGAMFGSFNLLHTGPVVMLSIMSLAAVAPLAAVGSDEFIALSIMLALMVGVLRLAMGLFRLGGIINLVSHPVLVGFTNAAALIIAFSQLRFILNVPSPGTGSFVGDMTELAGRLDQAYLPAVAFALAAGVLLWTLARWLPRVPAVLLAVVFGTVASAAIGFEQTMTVPVDRVADAPTRAMIDEFRQTGAQIRALSTQAANLRAETRRARAADLPATELEALRAELAVLEVRIAHLRRENNARRLDIHAQPLVMVQTGDATARFYRQGHVPEAAAVTPGLWRFYGISGDQVKLAAGGEVVGNIPQGLPDFKVPMLDWNMMLVLLPAAFVMALIGFMEATSISKALATRTRQRIDTNKELIGQGLANVAGAFFQSYTVSGSFSRSAVAGRSGAQTGLYAVVSALVTLVVLLFLTGALYHLPQSVLAMIVMMAVFGLIRVRPILQAWKVQRSDAVAGIVAFVATLAFAPDIANGILVGMALTAAMFLMRTMRPRATVLGRMPDGTLAGTDLHVVEPLGRNFVALRFDRSLNYLNVAAFEDSVLEALAQHAGIRAILVIGTGINEVDASGEEKLRELQRSLADQGVTLLLTSLKAPVAAALERSGLLEQIGRDNVYSSREAAVEQARRRFDSASA